MYNKCIMYNKQEQLCICLSLTKNTKGKLHSKETGSLRCGWTQGGEDTGGSDTPLRITFYIIFTFGCMLIFYTFNKYTKKLVKIRKGK